MSRRPFTVLACASAAALALSNEGALAQRPGLPEVLKESIAYYSTLTSYADTGTVRQEMPGLVDESKFTTYFRRAGRDLYFDYQALTSTNPGTRFTIDMSSYRTVIWMFKGTMQTFDFKAGVLEAVPSGGGQVQALQRAAYGTRGTSTLVPSLLYSQARLPGTLLQIENAMLAGYENLNQHRCHKVVGTAVAFYQSGARTNERPVTVWIDAQSRLIRRVFEDTPKSYAPGTYSRLTITVEPRANPAIEDARFQFKPK